MKKHLYLFFALMITASMTNCGGSDDSNNPPPGEITVQNPYIVKQGNGPTGNTNKNMTGIAELDNSIEIPRVLGDNNHPLLIRVVPTYGLNYVVEWDNLKRSQRWTAYRSYNGNSGNKWKREYWKSTEWGGDPFQSDPDLPQAVRTELSDYSGSGYTRGHIIASQDRVNSKEANEQTFYLSNMQPQLYSFNGAPGVWGQMEIFLRDNWNKSSFRDYLYVVKGGTIRDDQIKEYKSNGRLLVPRYFFMAAVCLRKGTYKGIAFWADHSEKQPTNNTDAIKMFKQKIISIDDLEAKTGIDFFCNLPDDIESQVESTVDKTYWNVN